MVWRFSSLCLALAFAICCSTPALAFRQLLQGPSKNAQLAQAFCKSSDIKKLQCDWATDEEQSKTFAGCLFCGNDLHYGEPKKLPQTIEYKGSGTFVLAQRVVSLACKPGRLQVQSVFRILPGNGGTSLRCTRLAPERSSLDTVSGDFSKGKRCELALPASTSASAAAAATAGSNKVKEVKCKEFRNCADLPEMQVVGKWYSDTYTVMFDGCNAVNKQSDYRPMTGNLMLNPDNKFELAAFRVSQA